MEKLQGRMRRDMELKNFSPKTINIYLSWAKRFVTYHGRAPEGSGDEEIRSYLHSVDGEELGISVQY